MAGTNIMKFDPSTLMEGVRDRIKATFVSLIPDDHWEALVKAEIDRFFNKPTTHNTYDKQYWTDFQMVCNNVLATAAREKVLEVLTKYTDTVWRDSVESANSTLVDLLTKHASEIFANTMGTMFKNVLSQMQYR